MIRFPLWAFIYIFCALLLSAPRFAISVSSLLIVLAARTSLVESWSELAGLPGRQQPPEFGVLEGWGVGESQEGLFMGTAALAITPPL